MSVRPASRGKIVFEGDGKAEMGLVWVWGVGKPGSRTKGIVSEGNVGLCLGDLMVVSGVEGLLLRGLVWGIGEGNGTPLQYSCLENPMDGGAW